MDWNMEVQKVENNNYNLTTCRHNQSGKCTNEEKRKECVEVSKRVLCSEDRENERRIKVIYNRFNNFT